jgi:ribonuclease P protein subunit RPR2
MRKRQTKPEWQLRIVKERIGILFDLAKKESKKHPERSKRYVELARRIGERYNVRFSKELKRSFCKNCNSLLISGVSCKVRLKNKTVFISCLKCNKIYRYPYS